MPYLKDPKYKFLGMYGESADITGGMGGLGLFLAAEMAAAGCGRIVLNARSAPSADAQDAIERIRATGVDVRVERGDIAEPGESTGDAFEEIDFGREFQDYLDPGYKTQEYEYKEDAPTFEQFLTRAPSLATWG